MGMLPAVSRGRHEDNRYGVMRWINQAELENTILSSYVILAWRLVNWVAYTKRMSAPFFDTLNRFLCDAYGCFQSSD